MAIKPPPIQEKVYDALNLFPQRWVIWFNALKDFINSSVYWFDYNNTLPAISHTGGGTTYLTNDGAGAYSTYYNPVGLPDVWDSAAGEFDFSSLAIGDVVTIRTDLVVATAVNNQEFKIIYDMAIGSGSDYSLNSADRYFKSINSYNITNVFSFYIGNEITKNYPAKIRFSSSDNATITVNGWFVKIDRA